MCKVYACCRVKKLYKSICTVYLKHLTAAYVTIGKLYLAKLVIGNSLDVAYHHKRTCNLSYCTVFLRHQSSLLSITSSISFLRIASIDSYSPSILSSSSYLKRPILSRTGIFISNSISAPFLSASDELS